MRAHLDAARKGLELYFEAKRQAFPRLYFVSDADLAHLLGQSSSNHTPTANVEKHLHQCFGGIARLTYALVDPPAEEMEPPPAAPPKLPPPVPKAAGPVRLD